MKVRLTAKEFRTAYKDLVERADLDLDFVFLTVAATIICTLGFIIDSAPVIIGAMVLSPILFPLMAFTATLLAGDWRNFRRMVFFMVVDGMLVISLSALIAYFFSWDFFGSEIMERLEDNLFIYFLIAFVSGLAGTFSFFWPRLMTAVTGVAISIALLPPLCILGIALVDRPEVVGISLWVVVYNFIGILIGSGVVFGFMAFFREKGKRS